MRPIATLIALATLLLSSVRSHAATRLEADLSQSGIEVGSSTTLVLRIFDPQGDVGEPRLELPEGLDILARDRSQSFSWINGKSTSEVTYRIELTARRTGSYSVGPVRIAVGRQGFVSNTLPLTVRTAAAPSSGGAGRGPAALLLDLTPSHPYVGEVCQLRVRLVQRVALAEASQYLPPSATGFWTERWSEPASFEAREGNRPVIVMERRLRLYPLATGHVRVGQAIALVTPASNSGADRMWGTVIGGQPVELRSDSLRVRVRPLPAGEPDSFDGAVGRFHVTFSLDRDHTTLDQAFTATLDVRGEGNLPLVKTPAWTPADVEVFGSSIEDSLAPAGELGSARRSFRWTLVPRREGTLTITPPRLAWFDPGTGSYRVTELPEIRLGVLSARRGAAGGTTAGWPEAFTRDPAKPGSKSASPWAAVIAGLAMGAAWRFARQRGVVDPRSAERAHQRELLRGVGLAKGPDFWRAADEALAWSEVRGERVLRLREEVHTARYGGQALDEEGVRRRVVERLGEALPPPPAQPPRVIYLSIAVVVALAAWWFAAPRPGSARGEERARSADVAARAGRIDEAGSEWRSLWRESPGSPALAARLAWAALGAERPADAAAWVLLGRRGEPRSASLSAAEVRVREVGALTGAGSGPLPIRSLEWAALACALALGAALEFSRRRTSAVLLALSLAASIVPLWEARAARDPRIRVVSREVRLEAADMVLTPGEVVRADALPGGRWRVRAGRDLSGEVPSEALMRPREVVR